MGQWRTFRWALCGTALALVLTGIGGRHQRLLAAARREAAARQATARLRTLEDRVIFHPTDREALVALAQFYQATRGPVEAAPLWARAAGAPQPASLTQLRSPGFAGYPPARGETVGGGGEMVPAERHPSAPRTAAAGIPAASPLVRDLDALLERAAREPDNVALQREVVAGCQRLNRLPAAIPALECLLRLRVPGAAPADEATWRRLGVAELQAGRTAAARDHLRAAASRDPSDAVALFYLGLACSEHGEVAEALAAFQQVQRLRPEYAPAALERIRLEIEDWRLREAAAEAGRLIQRRPRLADAYYQLGVALYHLQELPAAETALRAAVRLDPHPARYHGWLGLTLLERNRLPEATAAFEAAVAHNPGYSNGFYQLGRAYLLQGRLDEAEGALRRAVILDPRFAEAYFSLGQLLTRRGRRDQAALLLARFQALADFEQRRRYLERRATVEPLRPEWRRRLADLYRREGLLQEAQVQDERAHPPAGTRHPQAGTRRGDRGRV